jgi:hypothetical protein
LRTNYLYDTTKMLRFGADGGESLCNLLGGCFTVSAASLGQTSGWQVLVVRPVRMFRKCDECIASGNSNPRISLAWCLVRGTSLGSWQVEENRPTRGRVMDILVVDGGNGPSVLPWPRSHRRRPDHLPPALGAAVRRPYVRTVRAGAHQSGAGGKVG